MAATRYVALLRGINVGGKNKMVMADLRDAFTDAGFAALDRSRRPPPLAARASGT